MPTPADAEYGDVDHLRRQAGLAVRSLLRPGTYIGTIREVALTAVHAAAYPMGLARDANRRSRRLDVEHDELDPVVADPETANMPVILVHGWIHNRSAFLGIGRVLRRHGLRHIHVFDYDPVVYDLPEVAGMLAAEVERVRSITGAEKVMIVGHSMGGVVARYYVQLLGGEKVVDTVISLGSPHRGTYAAHLGWGKSAPQMRPGHPVMRKLQETARPTDVRWVAIYSDLDFLIVPAINAKLTHPALRAHNIKVTDLGHLSLLMSGEVMRELVAHLSDRSLHRAPVSAPSEVPFGDAEPGPAPTRTAAATTTIAAARDEGPSPTPALPRRAGDRGLTVVPPLAAEG